MVQFSKLILRLLLVTRYPGHAVNNNNEGTPYGADCSFPIHHHEFHCGNLLGDRKGFYDSFMNGCIKRYGKDPCMETEKDRLEMSLRQPQSMVNYTSTGFKHLKAPKELWTLLKGHWEKHQAEWNPERWPKGSIYTNHWLAPTYMVSVGDPNLEGAGSDLQEAIWDAAKETIEEWTQMEQQPTSMYGIRVYTTGAILSPHVDRLPLVSSAIINVAQDVSEDWPLEIYDRNGNAVNVTMKPGDMVLYESGSLIHGRPFPLKGSYYANIFIHFEPTGRPLNYEGDDWEDKLDDFYPPYLLPDSPELEIWERDNPTGWREASPAGAQVDTSIAHQAAAQNDLSELSKVAAEDKRMLVSADANGWQPIHEAARAGNAEVVAFLVDHGADVNALTHPESGLTPLEIAVWANSLDHPVAQALISLGGMGSDL